MCEVQAIVTVDFKPRCKGNDKLNSNGNIGAGAAKDDVGTLFFLVMTLS